MLRLLPLRQRALLLLTLVLTACTRSSPPAPLASAPTRSAPTATRRLPITAAPRPPTYTIAAPTFTLPPPPGLPPRTHSTPTNPLRQPTPTAALSATPVPSDFPLPTTTPYSPTVYAQQLADFVNADPHNKERLGALLEAWMAPAPGPAYTVEGVTHREVDLNQDGRLELVIGYAGICVVLAQDATGRYVPHWTGAGGGERTRYRIWMVDDINADGWLEVVLHGKYCGAHTCFEDVFALQWSANDEFQTILAVSMSYATTIWVDVDADGALELIMSGGTVGSVGAGIQRVRTDVYAWDGQAYGLASSTVDPVDSQHPYWQMIDAYQAQAAQDDARARALFTAAAYARPPYPQLGLEYHTAQVLAVARFQALYMALRDGDTVAADDLYALAQREDGQYAIWTQTLMDEYQQSGDLRAACAAAQSSVEEREFITGFNYAHASLAVRSLLCGSIE